MAHRNTDRGLSEQELAEFYDELEGWGEHPTYKMIDWRDAVARDETRLGYWSWVASCIVAEEGGHAETTAPERPGLTTKDVIWLSGLRISYPLN
jgi:hypothetical protein